MFQAAVTPIMPAPIAQADHKIGPALASILRNVGAMLILPDNATEDDARAILSNALMLVEDVLAMGTRASHNPDVRLGGIAYRAIGDLHFSLSCLHGSIGDTLDMADIVSGAADEAGEIGWLLARAA